MIHIYCGDGKGKTTAALGLAMRYTGYGHRVVIAQFQKTSFSGEMESFQKLPNVFFLRPKGEVTGFSWELTQEQKETRKQEHEALFRQAASLCTAPCLVILDEIISAINTGCMDEQEVLQYLEQLPEDVEVVLTGRDPNSSLCAVADYITEMKKRKHPMDRGIYARKGIEY